MVVVFRVVSIPTLGASVYMCILCEMEGKGEGSVGW